MKILVVGDAASVNVRRWCEGLAGAGADVEIASFAEGWDPAIPAHRLPVLAPGPWRYLAAVPTLRLVVRRFRPDLVVGYFVSGYGTAARLSGARPLVQVTAGADVIEADPGTAKHRFVARNLRAADLVVAWADHMAEEVYRFGVSPDHVMVQLRGIPLDGYAPRAASEPDPATRVIVTRSLTPIYAHDLLIAALAEPVARELTLTVAGDGPERPRLGRLSGELGVDGRVDFLGRVPNDVLPGLLARHDVYVSARPHDGVSASLLEAMAAGLVPVVIDHPANRDWIVDGTNGVLVKDDPASLASGMWRAATDSALRDRARSRNPEIVRERGDLRRNMPVFLDRFRELL